MATNASREMWATTRPDQEAVSDVFADPEILKARVELWRNEILRTKGALDGSRRMKQGGFFAAVGGEGAAMTAKALLKVLPAAVPAAVVPLAATAAVGSALALFGAGLMIWGEAKHKLNNRSRDRMTSRTA